MRHHSIFDFHQKSIVRTMSERISAYQDGVAFGRIDCQGGRSAEMGAQAMGLYPRKYGAKMPVGEESVEANIFANCFSAMVRQYPSKNFRAESWIYGPPSHWWRLLVCHILKKCEISL